MSHSPTHGFNHIFADITCICKGVQFLCRNVLALINSITIKEVSNLLTGNRRIGFKRFIASALSNLMNEF